jgi:energy-converting hydrogenase Eha subunit A
LILITLTVVVRVAYIIALVIAIVDVDADAVVNEMVIIRPPSPAHHGHQAVVIPPNCIPVYTKGT